MLGHTHVYIDVLVQDYINSSALVTIVMRSALGIFPVLILNILVERRMC